MELHEFLDYANEQFKSGDDFHRHAAEQLTHYPVTISEFIESPEYLNDTSVYPANMETLEQLNNPDGLRIGSCYTEAVIAGAIGVGKSTIAILSLLYQIYVLSCLRSPQGLFDLSTKSGDRLRRASAYRAFGKGSWIFPHEGVRSSVNILQTVLQTGQAG